MKWVIVQAIFLQLTITIVDVILIARGKISILKDGTGIRNENYDNSLCPIPEKQATHRNTHLPFVYRNRLYDLRPRSCRIETDI